MTSTWLPVTNYLKMKNYQEFYQRLSAPFRCHPRGLRLLRLVNQLVVIIMYLAYLVLLAVLFWQRGLAVWPFVAVPGTGFILLTVVRNWLNAPRPYEEWAIQPLIIREKTGDSLPSRHVFSAAVIAMVCLRVAWPWGILMLGLTVILALVRVVGGVHYPRDVIIGFLCGVLCGALLWMF